VRLDEGKGGGHSHAILSAFKGEIIILVLKGPVDSMFQNYLHAMLAMILLCTGLVRPGGRGCRRKEKKVFAMGWNKRWYVQVLTT
jgi:hypothetical protein